MSTPTTFDMTAANAALKELYQGQEMLNLVYEDNPFLAMIQKDTSFGGKYKPIPIITGVSQGRSATFSTAQTNQSALVSSSFLLTRKKDYSIAQIDNETMLASATDKMAFIEGAKAVVDGAVQAATLSLSSALFRSGTGSIGKIAAGGITSGVITLSDATTVTQFEINMVLQANATDGGTPRAALGYVIAVDRTAGTVTVASSGLGGNAASPASWAPADFLLVQGDNNAKLSGLAAWIPATAPSATTFYGVDRSADPVRLGGVRYDGSAQSVEEALIDASNLVAREGGRPKLCVTNYATFGAMEKALGAKVQYVDAKGPADVGFRGIMVNGANTTVSVFPDRSCPGLVAYLIDPRTVKLETLGDAPMILRYSDGNDFLRVYNADSGEVRVGYYGNMSCNAPGRNAVVTTGA